MPRARKPPEEDEGPSKAWMESYADAMTLLLAFFIMMYAFALVDETKFHDFKVGMVQALGISDPINDDPSGMLFGGDGIADVPGTMAIPSENVQELLQEQSEELGGGELTADDAEQLKATLEAALDAVGAGDHVSVDLDERGVVMRFDARVLFPSGQAHLGGDGGIILGQVGNVLTTIDNMVDVEGHTDTVPTTGTRWPTNWELSTARASTVVRYFAEIGGLPPARLAATGYADTRPRASNSTEDGRRQNRRVEVVVLIAGLAPPTDGGDDAGAPAGGDQAAPSSGEGAGGAAGEPAGGATPASPGVDTGIDTGISTGISPAPASPLLQN